MIPPIAPVVPSGSTPARRLITTRHTSGKTLSAFYRGQRVLFMPKRLHLAFYARVKELEMVAALAEICVTVSLRMARERLHNWLAEQCATRTLPMPELVPLLSIEEKRAIELKRRGWLTFDEGMQLVYQAMFLKGQQHDETIRPITFIAGNSAAGN